MHVASSRTRRLVPRAALVLAVITAVLTMTSNAFAASLMRVVSTDPYTNTSSAHKAQLEPDTFSFGSTVVSVFQSGRFFDGGSSNICYTTTTNNGGSWTKGCLPGTTVYATPAGTWARISDPSVSYDPQDNVWMVTGLAIDASATGKAVLVSRSTDGGLTFQNPVTVSQGGGGSFYDKEWIGCDTWSGSPNYGNCYVEWDDAFQGNKLLMRRSTDGGLTWSASTVPNSSVIGGQPLVQPNGTVVVPINTGPIASFVSTNGGVSYSGPFTISSNNVHFPAGGLRSGEGLPSAEVSGDGTVYVAFYDCRFRTGCPANDIVYSTSTDGQNWSSVVRVPIDPTTSTVDHFIPGIGVDKTTSGATTHIGITYYFYPQANCNSSTCLLSAGFISSTDAGATWSAPVTLFSNVHLNWLAPTNQGTMVGDYISTSFGSNGKAYPVISAARSTGQTCTASVLNSCNEPMVAPKAGLTLGPDVTPVGHDQVVAGSLGILGRPATAF
jgi:hypothetical protein